MDAETLRAVADRTMRSRYFFWDWGESIVTRGLLAADEPLMSRNTIAGSPRPSIDGWSARLIRSGPTTLDPEMP